MSADTNQWPCPSDETLSAFIDGRLDEEMRRRVAEHMKTCETCYSVLVAANDFAASTRPPASDPVLPFRKETRNVILGLAAAAVVVLAILTPLRETIFRRHDPMRQVAEAAPAVQHFHGRLSGIPFRGLSIERGAGDAAPNLDDVKLSAAAAAVAGEVQKHPTVENYHALGAAFLLERKPAEAVAELETALKLETGTDDVREAFAKSKSASLLTDLAAAYDARGGKTDLLDAVECAQRAVALTRSPVTLWNLATAYQSLPGNRAKARQAWADFLKVSDSPEAADYARQQLKDLDEPAASQKWDGAKARLRDAAVTQDDIAVSSIVAEFPQPARLLVEDELLPAWGSAAMAGHGAEANECLTTARAIARAARETTGEEMLIDTVSAIDRASSSARAMLARGHARYGEARVAYDKLDIAAAQPALSEARASLSRGGSPFAMEADVYLAGCAYYASDYDRAMALTADLTVDLSRRPAYRVSYGMARWIRAISRVSLGQLNEAIVDYESALAVFRAARDDDSAIAMTNSLATTYDNIGDDERAWEFRQQALRMLDRYGAESARTPQVLNAATRACVRARQPFAATFFLDRELAEALRRSWFDIATHALVWRSEVHASLGDLAAARNDVAEARALIEHRVPDAEVRQFMLSEPAFVRAVVRMSDRPSDRFAAIQPAVDYATRTHNHQRQAELLALLGRAYADTGRDADAERTFAQAVDEVELQRPGRTDLALFDAYVQQRHDLYEQLVTLALRRNDAAAALAAVERSRQTPFTTSEPESAPDFSVPPSTTAIVFSVADDSLRIWSIRDRNIQFRAAAVTRAEIERLSGSLQAAANDAARFGTIANELSATLVAPWIETARGSRLLVFVVDDTTATIPFAALTDPSSHAPLIERFAIVSAPSLATFHHAARQEEMLRRRAAGRALSVFVAGAGAPDEKARLSAINVGAEVGSVAEIYGLASVQQDSDIRKGRFLAAVAENDIFHFAGHAVVDRRNPLYSAIVVQPADGESRYVYAHEIAASRFDRTRVVVLSACDSASWGARRNRSVGSLARAFVAAGVPTVVGTLWSVQDGAASSMIRKFHEEIRAGRDAASALRVAQLAAMRTQPPSVWAAFQAIGGVA